jgi:hypothetical protein
MGEAQVDTLTALAAPCLPTGTATALIDAPFADAMSTNDYESAPLTACCKICTAGIACGNTCISANYTCHVGAGCACNGGAPVLPPPPPGPQLVLGAQSPYPRIQVGQSVELTLRVARVAGPIWYDTDVGLYVTNTDEISGNLRGWDDQGLIAMNRSAVSGLVGYAQQDFKLAVQGLSAGVHRLRVGFKHRTAGWFGPTGVYWDVAVDPTGGVSRVFYGWHSSWVSQSPYLIMQPGQIGEFWIVFKNLGTETWRRGRWMEQVNLALNYDDKEPFRLGMAADWLWDDRIATTTETEVPLAQTGRFVFKVRAPATAGVYLLNLRPVVDGRVWLEDQGVFWVIDVRN